MASWTDRFWYSAEGLRLHYRDYEGPRDKPPIHRALWITVACVALPSLFYQNSGWVQFGYRFSLDYMVFLVMLIAIGGRPLGRVGKALIVAGVAINLFGALTFDREWSYYRVGGKKTELLFSPLEKIDRRLRPEQWNVGQVL